MNQKITNDFALDANKDKFKPPSMEEIQEDAVIELFSRLNVNIQIFYEYVYKSSEYYTDKGKKFYLVKDVAHILSSVTKKD